MKVLLARLGILGSLLVLSWITIAHAQRGEGERVNPLREPAAHPASSPQAAERAPDATPRKVPASRPPVFDPFGPEDRQVRTTGGDERAAGGPVLVGPQANTGQEVPDNVPAGEAPAVDDRRVPNPSAYPSFDRREEEPAPFQADPLSPPVKPLRPAPHEEGSAEPISPSEGTGLPGDQRLEGAQTPQLTIHKTSPREVQVGKPAVFRLVIRNNGATPTAVVEVRDQVPRGSRLLATNPPATRGPRGELIWSLGILQPGEEQVIEVQLLPLTEGEIGSVATVHFSADATARTVVTRPNLVLETSVPPKVMIGDSVTLSIVLSNTGTGVARGVVLEERIPAGLSHPAGSELEYTVGDLKPGESRKLELPLKAERAGLVTNVLLARDEGNLRVEDKIELEVLAPQLDVTVEGPKRRYLERQAVYQVSVSNPGTAPAKQVELAVRLPEGLKFVRANNAGYYEESTHTVHWRLEELPANETGSVELVTIPVEIGRHALKLRGTAQKGLVVEKEQPVIVEGIAAIHFQVSDTVDPLEVGGETIYEVRVTNQGTKAAGNVRLSVLLPPQLQPLAAEGPSSHVLEANRIVFDSLAQLPPKAETIYRVRVKAVHTGDLRTRFQLTTDDMQLPVVKEESTRVFGDE